MTRVLFSDSSRQEYFTSLKSISRFSWDSLARELNVSCRQLRDWRKGTYSFPAALAETIQNRFGIVLPNDVKQKQDYWHISKAASTGGKQRFALHGSPGTTDGRRKGGLNSLKIHALRNTGFKLSKSIHAPANNTKLAELVGILMGDGSLSAWQAKVTLNLKNDRIYSLYVAKLFTDLFLIKVGLYERVYNSTLEVVVSSNKLVSFLNSKGLPIGDKIKHGLDIPLWVYKRKSWQRACLRGLFDTDGCTYVDSHKYDKKEYAYIGLAFTSYSETLLESIAVVLKNLGYSPTKTSKWRVFLRREKEVIRFFQEINPRNVRHHLILRKFLEEYRSGYNGAASKAAVAAR